MFFFSPDSIVIASSLLSAIALRGERYTELTNDGGIDKE